MSADVPLEFPITDPYNVPITFASELLGIGSYNGVINITLGAARFTPTMSGVVDADRVIVSRLRLDLVTAKALRDALSEHIERMGGGSSSA
ncbi:MAG: hypothetical protein KF899_04315 [Parvibaculum sp.]|nr:hypothetical protein [Parvibaculum sp.]